MLKHTVYIGDCVKVMENFENETIDLTVTSPPYYNAREYSWWGKYNDYLDFMEESIKEIFRCTKDGSYFCLNTTCYNEKGKLYPIPFDLLEISKKIGFELIWDVIWIKPKHTQALWRSSDRNYKKPYPLHFYLNSFHEYVWILRKGEIDRIIEKQGLENSKIEPNHNVMELSYREWYIPTATPKEEKHAAPFPVELAKNCIKLFSKKEDTVFDPFLGSGTTIKAAKEMGRNSIGIEINDKYLPVIKEKIGMNYLSLFKEHEHKVIYYKEKAN